VATSAGELVWVRGYAPPERYSPAPDAREAILIEILDASVNGGGN
jgi:hypothetical protein